MVHPPALCCPQVGPQLPLLLHVKHSWRLGLSGVTFLAVAETARKGTDFVRGPQGSQALEGDAT